MIYSVILPVFNEDENLEELLRSIVRVMNSIGKEYEIICIDDGSSDKSLKVLNALKKTHSALRVIKLDKNYGQSTAIKAGLSFARGEMIIILDSDLQNDPEDIPKMLSFTSEFDVICGIRQKRNDNIIRRLSSKIANNIRRGITGDNIKDIGCSLRIYKRSFLENIFFFDGIHRFLPLLLKLEGARVLEIPVRHHPRIHGKAKYGIFNRVFRAALDLMAVKWMQKRRISFSAEEINNR